MVQEQASIMWIWGIFAIVGFLAGIAIGLNRLE
jgi:hypothetical protein